jgi:hypothetical protein
LADTTAQTSQLVYDAARGLLTGLVGTEPPFMWSPFQAEAGATKVVLHVKGVSSQVLAELSGQIA